LKLLGFDDVLAFGSCKIAEQLPRCRVLGLPDRHRIKPVRCFFDRRGLLAHLFQPQRPDQPDRLMPHEPAHVLRPD